MVRCADFYEKWKRDPNWCEKSPKAVEQIDHYLALVDEIATIGVDPIAIYKYLPEKVGREIYKLTGDRRKMVVVNSSGKIKRGVKVSTGDVNVWLGIEPKTTSQSDDRNGTKVPKPTPDHGVKSESAKPTPVAKTAKQIFYDTPPTSASTPASPPAHPPASMTPDKEHIVKECLTAILTPNVLALVDAMIAGGKWEKTYTDFLVIVVKDGVTRKA
jgi:hypothetical protein